MSTPQLPLTLDQISGQGNQYDSGPAVAPQTQVPMVPSPEPGPAPDISAPPSAPLSGVDLLANSFLQLLSRTPPPPQAQNPTQRGGFADKLQSAIGNVGAGLGDASHANDTKGGGWLTGVTNTLAARNERVSREKQQQFENQERKRNDDINIAKANAELVAHARNMQLQDDAIRHQGAGDGAAFINTMRDNFKVTDDVSQNQLNDMVKKDSSYLQTHTARITRYEPVMDSDGKQKMDANGLPVESPVWSIVDLAPGDMSKQFTVTAELAKKWDSAGVVKVAPGTKMPASVANGYDMKALRYSTTLGLLNKSRVDELPAELKDQLATTLSDSEVQHAIASKPGNALDGLYTAKKNLDDHVNVAQQQLVAAQKSGDLQKVAAAQQQLDKLKGIDENLGKAIGVGFTDAERGAYAKDQAQARKDAEKERHEREEENLQNRRLDIQAQKETQQKGLGDSYKTENKEFDGIRKPLDTSLGAFSTLRSSLDQGTAAGDSVVAPALLKALVAGGGVRITQAEINQFTHGRSTVEDMKGVLQKMSNGKSITPEQRQQVYSLVGAVEAKAQAKKGILEDAQDALDGAITVADQRKAVSDARRKLDQVDAGQYNPNQSAPRQNQPKLPAGVPQGSILMQAPGGQPHWISPQNIDAARKVGASEVK